jgi:hypothetical protein
MAKLETNFETFMIYPEDFRIDEGVKRFRDRVGSLLQDGCEKIGSKGASDAGSCLHD